MQKYAKYVYGNKPHHNLKIHKTLSYHKYFSNTNMQNICKYMRDVTHNIIVITCNIFRPCPHHAHIICKMCIHLLIG